MSVWQTNTIIAHTDCNIYCCVEINISSAGSKFQIIFRYSLCSALQEMNSLCTAWAMFFFFFYSPLREKEKKKIEKIIENKFANTFIRSILEFEWFFDWKFLDQNFGFDQKLNLFFFGWNFFFLLFCWKKLNALISCYLFLCPPILFTQK